MSAAGSLFVFTNSTKNYSLAALIRYVEYIQNISFSQGSLKVVYEAIEDSCLIGTIKEFVDWFSG